MVVAADRATERCTWRNGGRLLEKAAGIGVRLPGAWGWRPPAKPAKEVTTGFDVELSDVGEEIPSVLSRSAPASPSAKRLSLARAVVANAAAIWHDLVSENGFSGGHQTVKRLVHKLRGAQPPAPRAVIVFSPVSHKGGSRRKQPNS
jgi:hypothetical protein